MQEPFDIWNTFAAMPQGPDPIPAEMAEPVQLLLDSLRPENALFLVQTGDAVPADWLTVERLEAALHSPLTEVAHSKIWPLVDNAWAIRLRMPGEADNVLSPLALQTLSRNLRGKLLIEWNAEQKPSLRLVDEKSSALEEEAASFEDQENEPAAFSRGNSPFLIFPLTPLLADTDMEDNIAELNAILGIIVNKQLQPQFQPLVSLHDGQVFGYEALIRGPKGTEMRRFGAMFRAANRATVVPWFDIACQEQCFAVAAKRGLKKMLFVNMDAEGLAYLDYQERSLAIRAREHGLSPSSIVIEITERQAVEDFPKLIQYINRLREQGFKIAIDDAGAGYNSLYTIAELKPDFVKIDRALTRNIDVNGERRALLATMVQYARQIGTAVLAEGAETREELATLIDLGVTLGQGYLMGKPADDFRGVPKETREFIQHRAHHHDLKMMGRAVTVGGMMRKGVALPSETPLQTAGQKFLRDTSLTCIVITEHGHPQGLLMREQLDYVLDMAHSIQAAEMLPNETVGQWMRSGFIRAGENTTVTEAARQVTTRSDISLETDLVVVNGSNHYVGIVPTRLLLEAAVSLEENRYRYADPLTNLPGRVALEQTLWERLAARESLAVIRVDIARFEAFNRRYGVTCGDEVLLALAKLISEVSAAHGCPDDYLAHQGGDDFVLLTRAERIEPICRELIEGFAKFPPRFCAAEDVRNGFMEVPERSGNVRKVPLFSLAVAGLSNEQQRLVHYGQIMDRLGEMSRQIQKQSESRYLINGE